MVDTYSCVIFNKIEQGLSDIPDDFVIEKHVRLQN